VLHRRATRNQFVTISSHANRTFFRYIEWNFPRWLQNPKIAEPKQPDGRRSRCVAASPRQRGFFASVDMLAFPNSPLPSRAPRPRPAQGFATQPPPRIGYAPTLQGILRQLLSRLAVPRRCIFSFSCSESHYDFPSPARRARTTPCHAIRGFLECGRARLQDSNVGPTHRLLSTRGRRPPGHYRCTRIRARSCEPSAWKDCGGSHLRDGGLLQSTRPVRSGCPRACAGSGPRPDGPSIFLGSSPTPTLQRDCRDITNYSPSPTPYGPQPPVLALKTYFGIEGLFGHLHPQRPLLHILAGRHSRRMWTDTRSFGIRTTNCASWTRAEQRWTMTSCAQGANWRWREWFQRDLG